jgi:hypothetical protein
VIKHTFKEGAQNPIISAELNIVGTRFGFSLKAKDPVDALTALAPAKTRIV